ncbi:MAG: hypothetical protein QM731_05150 [Chitinophagaceae bacterium]
MDLKRTILKEHSKAQKDLIVKYIGNDKERFAELMKLFFAGEYRVTQRAAWPMSYCVRNHPELVKPYFKKLIDLLQKPGVHNGVVRNILRLLQDVEIPKTYHGKLMSICFALVEKVDEPAANKAFSLTILDNFSKLYPDIRQELQLIIRERWDYETAAFKSRGKKIIG